MKGGFSVKIQILILIAVLALAAPTMQAQREHAAQPNTPRANQGHVPPAPPKVPPAKPAAPPPFERDHDGRINGTPHVNHDHWYGNDRPNDPRYRPVHPPAPRGRFVRFGPGYRYDIIRIDRGLHRVWVPGGFFFQIAVWDWPLCEEWCWGCGDDFVIYEDPDHPGWYLLYNVHTGQYVHVEYLGM